MADDALLSELEDALEDRHLDVERLDSDTFEVSKGTGLRAPQTQVDPGPLLKKLTDDDQARRRQIAGWARGIQHVFLEPGRSDADEWDFVESAGGLVPSLEIPTFDDGVRAATGDPVWSLEFTGDLIVTYFIQLDRGIRVLTDAQVDRWGVSEDRITAGARSKLFHETRDLDFTPYDSCEFVHRLHAGDGHDAARCFVVADAFFTELDADFRFALPSPDHFLCVFDDDEAALQELSRVASTTYHESDSPLTTDIFRFETSKPVISQEYSDE